MAAAWKRRSPKSKPWQLALIVIFLPVMLPLVLVGLILHVMHKSVLYLLIWLVWLPTGRDILFVCSDSPVWHQYMEDQIFPLVEKRAIVLNWSDRKKWSRWSLAVRVFQVFGTGHNFNPMVILFRPLRQAQIFRFFPAFKDWKHGKATTLDQLRSDLMLSLRLNHPAWWDHNPSNS